MARIIRTQPDTVRGVFPVSGSRSVVVRNDPELFDDDDYAPGVMDDLIEAWENRDYFLVELVDKNGRVIDSIGSMAGYGGPQKAAKVAMREYFSTRRRK